MDAEELVRRLVYLWNDLDKRIDQDPQYQLTFLAELAVLRRYLHEAGDHVPADDPVRDYLDFLLPDVLRNDPIWARDIHRMIGGVLQAMHKKNPRLRLPPELLEPERYSSGAQRQRGVDGYPDADEPPAWRARRMVPRPVARHGATFDWVG